MKKGLRPGAPNPIVFRQGNTDRPDEEGIKTEIGPIGIPLERNTDRPDEEGIKTQPAVGT